MNPKARILIVEDDPDSQAVIAYILGYLTLVIDIAADAEQAGDYLFNSDQTYGAVIIDLALPGKDGWKLFSEIKAHPSTHELPCIAVTAYHTSRLREEALRNGFKAYFSKPIDASWFIRQLEAVL